jgi:hypothetical protein
MNRLTTLLVFCTLATGCGSQARSQPDETQATTPAPVPTEGPGYECVLDIWDRAELSPEDLSRIASDSDFTPTQGLLRGDSNDPFSRGNRRCVSDPGIRGWNNPFFRIAVPKYNELIRGNFSMAIKDASGSPSVDVSMCLYSASAAGSADGQPTSIRETELLEGTPSDDGRTRWGYAGGRDGGNRAHLHLSEHYAIRTQCGWTTARLHFSERSDDALVVGEYRCDRVSLPASVSADSARSARQSR